MGIKTDFSKVTDENLFKLCRQFGERARFWRQKFIGLLPEVYKRKLYEKKGFLSIFEFAKKLAGLSEEQVRRVLNLEKKFKGMPVLKSLLMNGEVSTNKLARVASIANAENELYLAGQVMVLSKSAVETLVRDEKAVRKNLMEDQKWIAGNLVAKNKNGLFEQNFEIKSVPGHTLNDGWENFKSKAADGVDVLRLSPDVQQKLFELQQKGIDINNLLLEFLKKREDEIARKKEEIAKKVLQKEQWKKEMMDEVADYMLVEVKGISRYKPVVVRNILKEEFGTKCSINNCKKLATAIHHTQRFSLSGSHDPRYLAPLCKEHHELAHAVDVNCQKFRWRKYS